MARDETPDYYEILQISPTAEPETVHKVYRLLAQRCHPDNKDTGNEAQFRQLSDAYQVLSDPERRAQYDVAHAALRQSRWRLVSNGAQAANDFEVEQLIRLTVLEVLYTRRRTEPEDSRRVALGSRAADRAGPRAAGVHHLVSRAEEIRDAVGQRGAGHHRRRRRVPGSQLRDELATPAQRREEGLLASHAICSPTFLSE